ncbi:zinc ribbon domain-containing protein [Haloarcula mannanilytica]|uniref:Zinc ribbon domain-containing protein n=1 Tax=Haloarcula mannanilytica TaxID=2509225 RepID=A0A4C2ER19_9EURY|nr:zinc ribbon domain-containing protein [Haloarcula mannanilytica]GCF15033.1 zinc ribbon domain-containing protein [Haloarcula mannanilytica]
MTETGRKRPLLAVVLAFIFPGLGHFYLRKWGRGLLWLGLLLALSVLLVVTGTLQPVSELTLEAISASYQSRPTEVTIGSVVITTLNVVDAYWVAVNENQTQEVEAGVKCPNCGKEIDQDIDFCHWCTTQLEPVEADQQ